VSYKTEVKENFIRCTLLHALLGYCRRDATRMGNMRTEVWLETLKGKDYFEDLSLEKRVILELI